MNTMEQYILGSHNTMTYLPPKKWYYRPILWIARCQNKCLYEQFNISKCRYFDIRVRFDKNGDMCFAHGPVEFKGSVMNALDYLNECASTAHENVYCRVILESNTKMKDQDYQEEDFRKFCEDIQNTYKHLIFVSGRRKYDWKVVFKFDYPEISLDDKYSSVDGKGLTKIWPLLYSKLYNKEILENGTDKECLFIDFV